MRENFLRVFSGRHYCRFAERHSLHGRLEQVLEVRDPERRILRHDQDNSIPQQVLAGACEQQAFRFKRVHLLWRSRDVDIHGRALLDLQLQGSRRAIVHRERYRGSLRRIRLLDRVERVFQADCGGNGDVGILRLN